MGLIKQPFGEPLFEKSGEGSGLVSPGATPTPISRA